MKPNNDIRDLFRRYHRPLCLYALHYLKDVDAAEDVVQEAFTAFWQTDDSITHARSYLYSTVRNRCIDILRRQGREAERLLPEDTAGFISDEEAAERSDQEARLWDAVDRLPGKRRELLLMSKRDGMSYEAIAQVKGLSINTVRNQISRALRALRDEGDRILDFILLFPALPLA